MTCGNAVIVRRVGGALGLERPYDKGGWRGCVNTLPQPDRPALLGKGDRLMLDSTSPSLPAVILQRIAVLPSGCWEWRGTISKRGYGMTPKTNGRRPYAHRVVYELATGPIPDGMQLDHTCHGADPDCVAGERCRHRRCVNPDHLEPVTSGENTRRGLARRTDTTSARTGWVDRLVSHCRDGHPYDEENTLWTPGGWRECRQCDERLRQAKQDQLRRLRKHSGGA